MASQVVWRRLPDDCLFLVFLSLSSVDRKSCTLVCRRWLAVEAERRHQLSLQIRNGGFLRPAELLSVAPSLFARYSTITELHLERAPYLSFKWCDKALSLISLSNLTVLNLYRWVFTCAGMAALARNCPRLRSFSGAYGIIDGNCAIAALLEECRLLHSITLENVGGIVNVADLNMGRSTSTSLRSIHLVNVVAAFLAPLIACSPNLTTLKVGATYLNPDPLFTNISPSLVQIHVMGTKLADHILFDISRCINLHVLHIDLSNCCTDAGLVAVANNCRLLRKIHIDGSRGSQVGDEGLMALLTCCPNLRELELTCMNVTSRSLGLIASNCRYLQHLSLIGIRAIEDAELFYIISQCNSLKMLDVRSCFISDHGIQTLANGFPNLVKVCLPSNNITPQCMRRLKSMRPSLIIKDF